MYNADDKRAFEDMLAEIADSDEDEDEHISATAPSKAYNNVSKAPYNAGSAGAKLEADSKPGLSGQGRRSTNSSSSSSAQPKGNSGAHMLQTRTTSSKPVKKGPDGYKMSKEDEDIENFGSDVNHSASHVQSEQIDVAKRWLMRSCSINDRNTMKCFVERERSNFGMQTTYRCFMEIGPGESRGGGVIARGSGSKGSGGDGNAEDGAGGATSDHNGGRFLMSACKRVANKTSYYLISIDPDAADDRGSETVLGKIRGNAIGSRYIITDHGLAPGKAVAPSMLRKEHGVVGFEFDSGGPSRIEAWVPHVSSSGAPVTWRPDSDQNGIEALVDSLGPAAYVKPVAGKNISSSAGGFEGSGGGAEAAAGSGAGAGAGAAGRITYLQNKTPKWDEAHGGHVLNFQGRVTESSVKNFQLCWPGGEDPDQVVLQFGRVGKHKFNMDLRFPLSPFQAFSICVACLDGKIADRKGYEYLRKFASGASNETAAASEALTQAAGSAVEYAAATTSSSYAAQQAARNANMPPVQREGSMQGSRSFTGMLMESIPSTKYVANQVKRNFGRDNS
mmetsp:Transcript_11899/g.19645  ORF Transcript_11899/g.19645 Transcript_11899/m.19645 type:complete len:561 (+) Transcript_11899:86-1768(+)